MARFFRTLFFLAIVAGLAYAAYVHFSAAPPGGKAPMGNAASVEVAEVVQKSVQQWRDFSGRLVAVDQVEVRPRVAGTIESVHFRNGEWVHKGDLLFIIDPRPYEAAFSAAEAKAAYAQAEYARALKLRQDGAIAQHDFDQRKSDAESASADLVTARINLDYTHIRSPIGGRVSRAEITEGNLVEAGGTAPLLTTVVSSDPIYADFEIDEDSFLRYVAAAGDQKRIPVMMGLADEDGAPHEGRIESFDNRLNTASGTIRVRAVFENSKGTLVPGLFARIRLGNVEETNAILITDRAIGTDQSKKFVIVVGADNKAEHREIKLGGRADGLRIVTDGLKPGEKIITSGMQRVMMPGQEVKPEVVPMDDQSLESGVQSLDKKPSEKP